MLLAIPAAVNAQIEIERLNSDVDPNAPIEIDGSDEGEGDGEGNESGEDGEGTAEFESASAFTDEELTSIGKALSGQVADMHTKCLKAKTVKRPFFANASGTAVWTVDEEGKATFKSASSTADRAAFFTSAEEEEKLKPEEREARVEEGNAALAKCLTGKDGKVKVEEKAGDVTLAYKVSWRGGKANVELTSVTAE